MADSSPQRRKKKKKLVRIREQVEVVLSPPPITQKEHVWITQEKHVDRVFMLNVVLTICAIASFFCGFAIYPPDLAFGMALVAAMFVGLFANAKASTLLHWDAFPRWAIAVLDAGLVLSVAVDIVVACIVCFGTQNSTRYATFFIWIFVMALAGFTAWILRADKRLSSAADFVDLEAGSRLSSAAILWSSKETPGSRTSLDDRIYRSRGISWY